MSRNYLNQCWHIVNWSIGHKFKLNLNQNTNLCIGENEFANAISKIEAISIGLNMTTQRSHICDRVIPSLIRRQRWWHMASIVHYSDVIMSALVSQITCVSIVCSTVCSGADQRKHQSSASLAFVRGIDWWLVDSLHKGQVTRKMFSFDDVIMIVTHMVPLCMCLCLQKVLLKINTSNFCSGCAQQISSALPNVVWC